MTSRKKLIFLVFGGVLVLAVCLAMVSHWLTPMEAMPALLGYMTYISPLKHYLNIA